MIAALLALAPFSDISVEVEHRPGPFPYRLLLHSRTPLARNERVRAEVVYVRVNGQTVRARLVPESPAALAMPKGAERHEVGFDLAPAPGGVWVQARFDVSVGDGPKSSGYVYRYVPPTDPADSELQRIRARYVGKDVWVYGGVVWVLYGTELYQHFAGLRPLRVQSVDRAPVKNPGLEVGHQTSRPLTMTFVETPVDRLVTMHEPRFYEDVTPPPGGTPSAPFVTVADGLTLSESVSLIPPPAAWQRDPARIERAMRNFRHDPFDTRRELLWILGPPNRLHPWRSVFTMDAWGYSLYAPFERVFKFRNGRVVERTYTGDLP